MEEKHFECYKLIRFIPIKTKIETTNFAKINNNGKAAKKYGVTTKSIGGGVTSQKNNFT